MTAMMNVHRIKEIDMLEQERVYEEIAPELRNMVSEKVEASEACRLEVSNGTKHAKSHQVPLHEADTGLPNQEPHPRQNGCDLSPQYNISAGNKTLPRVTSMLPPRPPPKPVSHVTPETPMLPPRPPPKPVSHVTPATSGSEGVYMPLRMTRSRQQEDHYMPLCDATRERSHVAGHPETRGWRRHVTTEAMQII